LNAIKAQALKIQAQAATLNSNNTADNSGVVTSSAPVVTAEKNTTDKVAALGGTVASPAATGSAITSAAIPGANADGTGPDTSGATNASNQYLNTLQTYMANLEARRASEVASITADFGTQQTNLENTQKGETGSTTAMLARSGGYLGNSGSGTGVLLNLAQTHASEMANLEAKKQAAITAAQNAIDDKQFAVAEKMATQATDIEKTINDRKQQFFDDTQKVITQQQSQQQFQQTKVQDDLKALSVIDPTTIPDSKKQEIDSYYGTPGFTDKYVASVQAVTAAKTAGDKTSAQKTILDMMQSIPEGKSITMPDGTVYTGVGKTSDLTTFMQVDNSGQGHLIVYNKGTGQTTVQNVGAVGKSSSSTTANPQLEDNVTALFLQGGKSSKGNTIAGLESTKLKDGTYDPDTYLSLRTDLSSHYPALIPKLDAKFLSVGANGSNSFFNDTSVNYLRQHGVYIGKDPIANSPQTEVTPAPPDNSISVGQ